MDSNKFEVKKEDEEKFLFAKEEIDEDELILEFDRNFRSKPTKYSLQVGENKHQYSKDDEAAENFIDHSCKANGYIDFSELGFRAKRKIQPGEKLTFNYLTTEWETSNKFNCKCGSKNCFGRIEGFKHLSDNQKRKLKPHLSPYLKSKLD